jgi:1-acyl-sn-glycerol-3-phosphate acyltransferase
MQTPPPLEVLAPFERFAVRLVSRMNRGRWQRTWFWCQREIGARWIGLAIGPLLEVHGLEHVAATSRERPLLLVSNHRSFFDLYVVMSTLFRRLPGWRAICFPVRGRYFYQTMGGLCLNALAAWWSMYPPFFHKPGRRRFDQWALAQLIDLCHEGPGRLIGFHPEGTRNKGPDPYALLHPQPGVGRLIHEARPQVIPVFVMGLGNNLPAIVARRWRGGERVRLWFGPAIEYDAFLDLPPAAATYQRIAEHVMARIAELGELDRTRAGNASRPARALK